MSRVGLPPLRLAFLLACGLLVSAPTHADVVMGPPDDCPSGARGVTSHYGPRCVPDECADDAECAPMDRFAVRPAGRVCRPAAFCVHERTVTTRMGTTSSIFDFEGPCAADGTCARGTCQRRRFCVDGGSAENGAAESAMTDTESAESATESAMTESGTIESAMTESAMTDMAAEETSGEAPSAPDPRASDAEGCHAGGRSTFPLAALALALVWRRRFGRS